jgi:hypothetical protein
MDGASTVAAPHSPPVADGGVLTADGGHDVDAAAAALPPLGPNPFERFPEAKSLAKLAPGFDLSITSVLDHEPLAYAFDGDTLEWASPPSAVASPDGPRVSAWFAVTDHGLFIAGSVGARDDSAHRSELGVSLAFTPPDLPPIAFASHLSGADVDEEWCKTVGQIGPDFSGTPDDATREGCLTWLAQQHARRAQIASRFVRVLTIDLARGKVQGAPGARIALRKNAGSPVTFEVEVPASALPETSEVPLQSVRLAARYARGSSGAGGRKTEPAWVLRKLPAPLQVHQEPSILALVGEHVRTQGPGYMGPVTISYVPSTKTSAVTFYLNGAEGGQWTPRLDSPVVETLDVARGRTLFTLGDVTIVAYPTWVGDFAGTNHPEVSLVSRRGDTVLDSTPSTAYDPYALVERAPGVHILYVFQGWSGFLGMGESGLMPGYQFEVATMTADGKFSPSRSFAVAISRDHVQGVEGLPGFPDDGVQNANAGLSIAPKLARFGLEGSFTTDAPGDGSADVTLVWHHFTAGYRWDPAAADYVRYGRADVADAGP